MPRSGDPTPYVGYHLCQYSVKMFGTCTYMGMYRIVYSLLCGSCWVGGAQDWVPGSACLTNNAFCHQSEVTMVTRGDDTMCHEICSEKIV